MKRILTTLLLLSTQLLGTAAELPATARAEIEQLLIGLGSSSCEFYRNGSWYPAVEAETHLRKKYEYLVKKEMIGSAEEFIAKGAAQSSMSGKAYQVRCPNEAAQPSALWLNNKLHTLR